MLLSQAGRSERKWVVVKGRDGYAVCDTQEAVGRIVADNIPSIDDALLMAAAPMLQEACSDAHVVFDDARDHFPDWGELADKLGAALDASARGRTGEENRNSQES